MSGLLSWGPKQEDICARLDEATGEWELGDRRRFQALALWELPGIMGRIAIPAGITEFSMPRGLDWY